MHSYIVIVVNSSESWLPDICRRWSGRSLSVGVITWLLCRLQNRAHTLNVCVIVVDCRNVGMVLCAIHRLIDMSSLTHCQVVRIAGSIGPIDCTHSIYGIKNTLRWWWWFHSVPVGRETPYSYREQNDHGNNDHHRNRSWGKTSFFDLYIHLSKDWITRGWFLVEFGYVYLAVHLAVRSAVSVIWLAVVGHQDTKLRLDVTVHMQSIMRQRKW